MKNNILKVKKSAKAAALLSNDEKNSLLKEMHHVLGTHTEKILEANQKDMENGKSKHLKASMMDRLLLTPERIKSMQDSLSQIIELHDPIGEITEDYRVDSGIQIQKKRIPIGVILMIYEARPNVAVEAASLCIKSGNPIILRGGSDAIHSNMAIANCWDIALQKCNLNTSMVYVVENTDRKVLDDMLLWDDCIDLVIPRGGEGLIRYVVNNSRIPVIQHYKGLCHLYIDDEANFEMGLNLLINGKVSRPGVCNALETLLVHKGIAKEFLPLVQQRLLAKQVIIKGCNKTGAILKGIQPASEDDFSTEYLDLMINIKVVNSLDEAILHIDNFGSHHTEVIVTENLQNAERFINNVDAAVVMVNASSRFSDGGELGLGAEIGISTSKVHSYGPMGLKALTTEKFIVKGTGQVRS